MPFSKTFQIVQITSQDLCIVNPEGEMFILQQRFKADAKLPLRALRGGG